MQLSLGASTLPLRGRGFTGDFRQSAGHKAGDWAAGIRPAGGRKSRAVESHVECLPVGPGGRLARRRHGNVLESSWRRSLQQATLRGASVCCAMRRTHLSFRPTSASESCQPAQSTGRRSAAKSAQIRSSLRTPAMSMGGTPATEEILTRRPRQTRRSCVALSGATSPTGPLAETPAKSLKARLNLPAEVD